MTGLNLKPTHKAVKDYYDALSNLADLGASHEGAVSPAFAALLQHCAHQFGWTLIREHRWPPFNRRLWQRNYYEHVVRDERDLERIRDCIATNPLRWALDRENPQRTGASPEEDDLLGLGRAPRDPQWGHGWPRPTP